MKIMKNKYVKYITVLDFEVGRVFQYKTNEMTDNGEGFCPYECYIIDKERGVEPDLD